MSKGSTQRPRTIADKEWEDRWDAIFAKDTPTPEKEWVQLELDLQVKEEE